METLKGGIFITPKDILLLTGSNRYRSAQTEHQTIRDALGKKNKRLTVKEYCDYNQLNIQEVIDFLNSHR